VELEVASEIVVKPKVSAEDKQKLLTSNGFKKK
jgi:hypothetical protein